MDENNVNPSQQKPQVIITRSPKSVGIALILTFLFSPLGMLYASVKYGLIMIVIAFIVGLVTLGFGAIITWPISMIWSYFCVKKYNEQLYSGNID